WLVTVFDRLNGLMHIGIEGFTHCRNRVQPFTAHDLVHLPMEHAQRLLQALTVQCVLVAECPLYVVHHTEEFMDQRLLLVLHAIGQHPLLTLAEVLHIRSLTQISIPVLCCLLSCLCELCF